MAKVKYVFTILVMSVMLSGCFEGPTGPQGEQGEQGEDGKSLEIVDITGVLIAGDMITGDYREYWDIELPDFSTTFFISVVVSAGSEYSWWNPSIWGYAFYDGKSYARIYREENIADSGFEYMISIAN